MILKKVKNGETFKVGDIEFIKFYEENEQAVVVAKDVAFHTFYGKNNNFKESNVLKRLETEFLPKIATIIGEDNMIEFETDLFSLDGLNDYGVMKSKVSLPTFDFYRANRKVFDKYKLNSWWWLSTPNGSNIWATCVSPSGDISGSGYGVNNRGVRPFCIFKSSISVS